MDDQLGLAWLCEHFEPKTYTQHPRLLILDGHGSHITWQFCQFALESNIQIICLPAHSTHLLQPLDVGIFSPLQHYYGKAADTHMRDTRTGVKKGTFWTFYTEAHALTFLPKTIQSAFRAMGIVPFNPNKVLVKVTKVTKTTTPNCPTTIFTTPRNHHQLRQQALAATSFFPLSPKSSRESYLAVVLRLADLTECALTEVEIAKAETQQLQEGYEGKRTIKADRRVLSKARIITGEDIIRLQEERKAQELRKPNQRSTKKKKSSFTSFNSSSFFFWSFSTPGPNSGFSRSH
ncbi:DDE-domain-containing protein [Choiromyces venosus 120613-1]|uniref:DDE-domain-containing protein n=1 Tax=Choiromyces venosus 120613-1 TaxID=1336337 RepID=A0A3N4JDZ8_9PEZI|nr:DDE-domain-containing protein [Choiromyces venosus 120613-1]